MAGLQYNYFFPTDFYYPRPQSVPVNDAGCVTAVSIQKQKKEVNSDDLEWPRSLGFRVHQGKNNIQARKTGVSMLQNQGTAYVEDKGKLVKYSPNPISWFTLIPEELSDSS